MYKGAEKRPLSKKWRWANITLKRYKLERLINGRRGKRGKNINKSGKSTRSKGGTWKKGRGENTLGTISVL